MKKKLTVFDLLQLKGKRQIHEVYVNNVEEAIAAEEAGIDIIVSAYGMPHHGIYGTLEDLKRIREAAPNTHLMSAAPERSFASADEAVRAAYKLLSMGCDSFYTNNSSHIIKTLRREKVPVVSHIGLIPGHVNWIGGYRAIGKTSEEAIEVLRHAMELDDAGAIGLEVEVVPPKVAKIITKKVKLMTVSMGSGSTCDAQYLFSQDVLGYNIGHVPRHSRIYRNFKKEFERLHKERVEAYKEFISDTENKTFNDPKITVSINDKEFESFLNLAEKI
ncbi:MAG: 3-methyl-2-oxobutanoate hydroxymethyltransferase [Alphaproteobacteria bacterium MarineAlpha5_Bin6]|nr:MAG: 3-methyl-2-oxobutanoate hydroxymethyltransferase [Alphaproteobacteria bacterium MarineAlpha5_Bin7]PPR54647.1 MAG: 3-methyl-2-oxobutanoate hydroxymethyltransferase [Alphaproteobacteria bacterium MarineAlpha5_Bin6]|tara:strand:+ start:265 stop:1089 length:825 start_codon:yes stop_codon:yes gene_type:complete